MSKVYADPDVFFLSIVKQVKVVKDVPKLPDQLNSSPAYQLINSLFLEAEAKE